MKTSTFGNERRVDYEKLIQQQCWDAPVPRRSTPAACGFGDIPELDAVFVAPDRE